MGAILAPPLSFSIYLKRCFIFYDGDYKKRKSEGSGNPRRTGSGFKRMMIQSVVWRGGQSEASRPQKMRELR
jgi:hypothetical protein